jgi:hypothetical protein
MTKVNLLTIGQYYDYNDPNDPIKQYINDDNDLLVEFGSRQESIFGIKHNTVNFLNFTTANFFDIGHSITGMAEVNTTKIMDIILKLDTQHETYQQYEIPSSTSTRRNLSDSENNSQRDMLDIIGLVGGALGLVYFVGSLFNKFYIKKFFMHNLVNQIYQAKKI